MERFFNKYTFSNHDSNKFILLLKKCFCPYEYMDDWEKFSETSLPEREDFYSHLNMEDITDADYVHTKRVCKNCEKKISAEYYDLYVMLLMIEKRIRGEICHAIHQYAKANNKYMKDYDKNKESSYLRYWDVNNLYGWAMSQKFSVNNFQWIEDTSQFNEDFIKNYNEESDE